MKDLTLMQKFVGASLVGALFILLVGIWYFVILAIGLAYGWALGSGKFKEWMKEPFTRPEEYKEESKALFGDKK